jgi:hypothetical protein
MLVPLAAAAAVLATGAPASAAEGGTRISNAPLVQWGEPEDGIGAHDIPGGGSSGTDFGHAFWRVRVFAGDRIAGTGSEGMNGRCLDSMWLYAPSVTDATLQRSKATFQTAVKHAGPSCDSRTYRWSWSNVPWTGLRVRPAHTGPGMAAGATRRPPPRVVLGEDRGEHERIGAVPGAVRARSRVASERRDDTARQRPLRHRLCAANQDARVVSARPSEPTGRPAGSPSHPASSRLPIGFSGSRVSRVVTVSGTPRINQWR